MDYNELGKKLNEFLKLENEPVAIKWSVMEPQNIEKESEKSRFCTKLTKAMGGEIFYSTLEEEACMGGARYCGLKDMKEYPANVQSGAFMVPNGLYKDIAAVQRSREYETYINPGIFSAVVFAPLNRAEFDPDVIFMLCSAKQGMEILHANAYDSGKHGMGTDAVPVCSSMAAAPYMTGKVTYGFGDVAARKNMDINHEDIMVSVPGSDLPRIVSNLEEMRTKMFFREE
ncbi:MULTISPECIES: DUF169 domain-containing protein [Methanobacterium]|uniref:DUF169 domain-containing protein n=1 Tax=Methanobacterium bryantii TaxID=2161 RepID=A0A2A2H773_METBR|nr:MULTISPECIES: DUF169 domain-containing protein [Methanobacterium]OEC85112.1 hypothetical protein A9507_14375 [Methanobacterium sp. A39]PAV05262.1 hypothetical protein ASJ80_09950 [Methanobacterium bryantii]